MKQVKIRCPYCGSMALLRPAKLVRYGASPEDEGYVGTRFPACDAYVAAHRDSRLPMGTLANKALCHAAASYDPYEGRSSLYTPGQ